MKSRLLFMTRPFGVALLCALCVMVAGGCSKEKGSSSHAGHKKDAGGSSFYSPPKADIVMDNDTGLEVIRNVINITLSRRSQMGDIEKIAASVNGEVVGSDVSSRFYQIRLKTADLAETEKISRKLLIDFKEIEMASKCPVSVHTDPYYVK